MIQHATPILHDFPYRVCVRCGSPIPAHDLVDDDYRPLHRSSCAAERTIHRPAVEPRRGLAQT